MGFAEHADDIASGVVERMLVHGEQPMRFAVIDYLRANGFGSEKRYAKEPVLYRATPQREGMSLAALEDHQAERSQIAAELRDVLDRLERHDRMVLLLHFRWGLLQHEIGDLYGFTESRANQYIAKALRAAKRAANSKARKRALNTLKLPNRKPRIGMIELSDDKPAPKPRVPAAEIPPFEVKLEDAIPLTEARKREVRPEIAFLLANMKPGQSAELPAPLAKLFAGKVKKLPDWKIAQRKGSAEGMVRTWRLEVPAQE